MEILRVESYSDELKIEAVSQVTNRGYKCLRGFTGNIH
jgi:hypothetical protein